MPEHPNSSGKGDEKVVLTASNRNGARAPQVETVLPAMSSRSHRSRVMKDLPPGHGRELEGGRQGQVLS